MSVGFFDFTQLLLAIMFWEYFQKAYQVPWRGNEESTYWCTWSAIGRRWDLQIGKNSKRLHVSLESSAKWVILCFGGTITSLIIASYLERPSLWLLCSVLLKKNAPFLKRKSEEKIYIEVEGGNETSNLPEHVVSWTRSLNYLLKVPFRICTPWQEYATSAFGSK